MRTNQLTISQKLLSLSLIMIVFLISSCNGEGTSENAKQEEQVKEVEIKAPKMDIHAATFMGDIKALEQHIKAGTDLNSKDAYGSTPLNIAATFGKTDVALLLIKGGASLSATNIDGSTPLHTAAFFCRTEIVEALLAKGADKQLKNQYGSTPLETVSAPFEQVKPIYLQLAKDLGPLGLRLDLERMEITRPQIVQLLDK